MYCRNCHDETQLDSVMEEYAGKARTPFYLYSAIILFLAILACWFYWKSNNEKNKSAWESQPSAVDVYTPVASST